MFQSKLLREASPGPMLSHHHSVSRIRPEQSNSLQFFSDLRGVGGSRAPMNVDRSAAVTRNFAGESEAKHSRMAAMEQIEDSIQRRMRGISGADEGSELNSSMRSYGGGSVLQRASSTLKLSNGASSTVNQLGGGGDDKERAVMSRLDEIKRKIRGNSNSSLTVNQPPKLFHNYQNEEKKEDIKVPVQAYSSSSQVAATAEQKQLQECEAEIRRLRLQLKLRQDESDSGVKQLKQHLEAKDQRNRLEVAAMSSDLQRHQRDAIERERDTRLSMSEQRTQLNQQIDHLQVQLQTEKANSVQLERKLEDLQVHYQHKLREMAETTQNAKLSIEASKVRMSECIDETEDRMEKLRRQAEEERQIVKEKVSIEWELKLAVQKKEHEQTKAMLSALEKKYTEEILTREENENKSKQEVSALTNQVNTLKHQQQALNEKANSFEQILSQVEQELSSERSNTQQLIGINKELETHINQLEFEAEQMKAKKPIVKKSSTPQFGKGQKPAAKPIRQSPAV